MLILIAAASHAELQTVIKPTTDSLRPFTAPKILSRKSHSYCFNLQGSDGRLLKAAVDFVSACLYLYGLYDGLFTVL